MKNQKQPFNAWWVAGISILFAFATLYLAVLHSSMSVQYAHSLVLAKNIREFQAALTNECPHLAETNMTKENDKALKSAERMKENVRDVVAMTSAYSLTGLLSLACAIGAFWGTPRKAAWLALPFGICAGMVALMWF